MGHQGLAGLGFDYAGQVVAVGKDVIRVQVGDEVFGCLHKGGNGAWSSSGTGGYGVAHQALAVKRDSQFPAADAGVYGTAYLSAWDGLYNNLHHNDSVYIPGAAARVAHFALQIAKTRTTKIVTSASRPETKAVAEQLQVPCFDYKTCTPDVEVRKHFPAGAQLVFDSTFSASSFVESAKALAPGGKLIVLGDLPADDSEAAKRVQQKGGQMVQADLRRYTAQSQHVKQSFLTQGLQQAQQWYKEGKVRPIISKTIDATVQTLQQELEIMKAGKAIGKVAVNNTY